MCGVPIPNRSIIEGGLSVDCVSPLSRSHSRYSAHERSSLPARTIRAESMDSNAGTGLPLGAAPNDGIADLLDCVPSSWNRQYGNATPLLHRRSDWVSGSQSDDSSGEPCILAGDGAIR